jgi:hypothetical protein
MGEYDMVTINELENESIQNLMDEYDVSARVVPNILKKIRAGSPYLASKDDNHLLTQPLRQLFNIPKQERSSDNEDGEYYIDYENSPRSRRNREERDEKQRQRWNPEQYAKQKMREAGEIPNVPSRNIKESFLFRGRKFTSAMVRPGKDAATIQLNRQRSKHIDGEDPISLIPYEKGDVIVEIRYGDGRSFAYVSRDSFNQFVNNWHRTHAPHETVPLPTLAGVKLVGTYGSEFVQK